VVFVLFACIIVSARADDNSPVYASISPNEKFAVPVDLSAYHNQVVSIGLPSLINNTWYLGIGIDNYPSSIKSSNVVLGIFMPNSKRDGVSNQFPMAYSYGNDFVYIELEYVGHQVAVNQTIIISIGNGKSAFENATLVNIPLVQTGDKSIVSISVVGQISWLLVVGLASLALVGGYTGFIILNKVSHRRSD
jgi:hypothetical protein